MPHSGPDAQNGRHEHAQQQQENFCQALYGDDDISIEPEDCYLEQVKDVLIGDGEFHYPQDEIDKLEKELSRRWRDILRMPRAVAVDIGFSYCESMDKYDSELAIRIHFDEKKDSQDKEGSWSCVDLSNKTFLKVIQMFGGRLVLEERESDDGRTEDDGKAKRVLRLDHVEVHSKNVEPSGPISWEKRGDYREHELYLRVSGEDKESFRVEFLNARYMPSGHVRTAPPVPNTPEFGADAAERLGVQSVEPLVGGISIGNTQGSSGTLGAVVWDATDGSPVLLSNWHVLGGVPRSQLGDPCYQPALFDGGHPDEDQVGYLKRWILDRDGDIALASIDPGIQYAPGEILGLWQPLWEMLQPKLGMQLRKWGRGSGFTMGFIDGLNMRVKVEYSNIGIQLFENQYRIAPIHRGGEVGSQGDSGAIWVKSIDIACDPSRDLVNCIAKDAGLAHHFHGRRGVRRSERRELQSNLEKHLKDHDEEVKNLVRSMVNKAIQRHFQGSKRENPKDSEILEMLASDDSTTKPCDGEKSLYRLHAYFAVCIQFAGDVPGSTLREHVVASSLIDLAKRLRFSFRPVFQDPDELVAQPMPRRRAGRRRQRDEEGRPTSQISTEEGRRSIGPTPRPDPIDGHP